MGCFQYVIFFPLPLLHVDEIGGDATFHGYKVIAQAYVAKVIESLR